MRQILICHLPPFSPFPFLDSRCVSLGEMEMMGREFLYIVLGWFKLTIASDKLRSIKLPFSTPSIFCHHTRPFYILIAFVFFLKSSLFSLDPNTSLMSFISKFLIYGGGQLGTTVILSMSDACSVD